MSEGSIAHVCSTVAEHLSVHEVDGLGKETFPVSGCFCARCSVASTRR